VVVMRAILMALVAGAAALVIAQQDAFLDHASPAVGSSVPAPPSLVTLWFTQDLEPAFSGVTVTNGSGQRVDLGNPQIAQGSPAELQIGLKPLPPGTYLVSWHVVSVDTHPTEGHFHLRDQAVSLGTGLSGG
jgi:copper resistance protein C